MRTIIKFGFGILAVMVVLAGLWVYHTPELYEGFYRSVYSYRVTIETDSVLHNATLYLPLPVFAGESKIGDNIVAENGSQPDDWNYSIVETEHGMMLAISTYELIPEFRSPPVPIDSKHVREMAQSQVPIDKEILRIMLPADHEINTKNPVGNESLLSPKYNLTRLVYRMLYSEGGTPPEHYEYESFIYVDYTASPDATVSIRIELAGGNGWWVHGWFGNEYRDSVDLTDLTLTGERHGWYAAFGNLVVGEGRYDWR